MEKPPRSERTMAEEALREAHRVKILDRLMRIKNHDPIGFRHMLAALAETDEEIIGQARFLDRLIDENNFADKVAEMLEVDTQKLISAEYVPLEELTDPGET